MDKTRRTAGFYIAYKINTTVFDKFILWIEQYGGNRK